jgi:glycosyltransferase involved in cell wall biosynthesis
VKILVVTVVHHPDDARIRRRQVGSLLEAGHDVTLAAPWSAFGADPGGIDALDLPRAVGRVRARSLLEAAALLREQASTYDVILIHDPELLLAVRFARSATPVVWDVHEDAVAALIDKPWLPRPLRRIASFVLRRLERWAEDHIYLILAEERYADRFRERHPVIRNLPPVPAEPPIGSPRSSVIYVGRISKRRGAVEMVALGRRLALSDIGLELVGPADPDVEALLSEAASDGLVTWHGFVRNEAALELMDGCLAGLSLLHDMENYRVSAPTKVYEYLSRGVPVITSTLPIPAELISAHGLGLVVQPEDLDAMERFIIRLRDESGLRREIGLRAHDVARGRFDWSDEAPRFIAVLERCVRDAEDAIDV